MTRYSSPQPTPSQPLSLFYPAFLIALAALAIALLVGNRTRLVEGGYVLDRQRAELGRLEMENRRLRLELASLSYPEALEERLSALPLESPANGTVFRLCSEARESLGANQQGEKP